MDSLSAGIPAKGLHDLMASAEEQLRQDKFAAAIADYDRAAARRARQSDDHARPRDCRAGSGILLRRPIATSATLPSSGPALVNREGCDLSKMLSPDRLQFVKNDLAKLATDNQKDARPPWFLQAFIAYNTGNTDEATRDLTEAHRAGGPRRRHHPRTVDSLEPGIPQHPSHATRATPQPEGNPAPAQPRPADLNK